QPGDAGLRDEAKYGREAVFLGRPVDVGNAAAGTDVCEARCRTYAHLTEPDQIEQHAVLGDGGARDVVPSTLDREKEAPLADEVQALGIVPSGTRSYSGSRLRPIHTVREPHRLGQLRHRAA